MADTTCLTPHQQQFIAGCWSDGTGQTLTKDDPVAGDTTWTGQVAETEQVGEAVAAARAAFTDWARRSYDERVACVEAFGEQLTAHKEDLAHTITHDTGKPLWEARGEVGAMIGKIDVSQTAYAERTGEREKAISGGRAVLRHRPHGVLAVFGPSNFPGHLPNGHIVPALLAGNTVVFKPSEQAPTTADLTIQCWQKAGLPAGVVNLVQGGRSTGKALAGASAIDGLLFTGGAATGKQLHAEFGGHVDKILALELGGNNPLVVAEDGYDIATAVLTIIQSAYMSGGQRCTCARRLLVPHGQAGDQLITDLIDALGQIKVDHPMTEEDPPFYGGLATSAAADALLEAQDELEGRGATVLSRLSRVAPETSMLRPGLIDITGVATDDEEHFGPLLKIQRYSNWDAAMEEANNTRFGLSAGLIGGGDSHWEDFRLRIRAGIVNWNRSITGAASDAPFGGIGDSGNHRPSAYYAADYCAWPMASMESPAPELPETLPHGISLAGIGAGS
ncbi:succinylglutamate-semialdehyde dehydrogenase [Salinisphaera orenii]|uniref:succinylglutamate-semialdehyde dehydrogenase n=1 Tax=Salinisphaera orenii TaxID=856731 RepID=UPI0019550CEF